MRTCRLDSASFSASMSIAVSTPPLALTTLLLGGSRGARVPHADASSATASIAVAQATPLPLRRRCRRCDVGVHGGTLGLLLGLLHGAPPMRNRGPCAQHAGPAPPAPAAASSATATTTASLLGPAGALQLLCRLATVAARQRVACCGPPQRVEHDACMRPPACCHSVLLSATRSCYCTRRMQQPSGSTSAKGNARQYSMHAAQCRRRSNFSFSTLCPKTTASLRCMPLHAGCDGQRRRPGAYA